MLHISTLPPYKYQSPQSPSRLFLVFNCCLIFNSVFLSQEYCHICVKLNLVKWLLTWKTVSLWEGQGAQSTCNVMVPPHYWQSHCRGSHSPDEAGNSRGFFWAMKTLSTFCFCCDHYLALLTPPNEVITKSICEIQQWDDRKYLLTFSWSAVRRKRVSICKNLTWMQRRICKSKCIFFYVCL